jgi:hypothetical protein
MHSSDSKLVGEIPVEIARELESEGLISRLPIVRSGGPISPDLIVVGAQVVTTLVTFAQIPETLDYLAARIHRWRAGRGKGSVKLSVRGPKGLVRLNLDEATEAEDIAALLRLLRGTERELDSG